MCRLVFWGAEEVGKVGMRWEGGGEVKRESEEEVGRSWEEVGRR